MRAWVGIATVSVVTVLFAFNTQAGVIFNSGSLHVSAHAQGEVFDPTLGIIPKVVNSNPSDVNLTAVGGSHSTSASFTALGGTVVTGSIAENVVLNPSSIQITGSGHSHGNAGGTPNSATGSSSGTMSFSTTDPSTPSIAFAFSTIFGFGDFTLKNSSNTTLMNFSWSDTTPSVPSSLPLPAGSYTLNWNWGAQPRTGLGGDPTMSFSMTNIVPEPTSLVWVLLAPLLAIRRNRAI